MNVAVLTEIIKETKSNWRFIFESPLYDNINFVPGQLVQLGFLESDEANGVPEHMVKRNYSVASFPDGSNKFELIVTYFIELALRSKFVGFLEVSLLMK